MTDRALRAAHGVGERSATAGRAQALAVAAVCWGALAFGGAYPWAFWPMAAVALAAGALGCASPAAAEGAVSRPLLAGLAALASGIAIQLVPLPHAWVGALSPNVPAVLEKTDFAYGAGLTRAHALSIDPQATVVALGLFVSLAVLVIGLTRSMASRHPRTLVEALALFGVVMALIGIVQKPVYAGRLLGFWQPEGTGTPFGPFVNRNHFAGWMAMALPLSLGLLGAGLERAAREVRPGWRNKVLWLSSPEANRLILLGTGALVMALSMVLTMSRSGISALAMSAVLMAMVIGRGFTGRSKKTLGVAYLAVLLTTTVAWVGADVVVERFSKTNWTEFNDRKGAWIDALGVARAFPVAGTGLNTYSTAARFYQQHDLRSFYGEAHNDYLQLLAEGGVLVALPALACFLALIREIRRRMKRDLPGTSWWLRRAAVAALVAIALQEAVEFSLQMPGNAVLFAVVCALAIHPPREARPDERGRSSVAERPRLRVVASNAFAGSR
jgi:O-antigen ligase